MTTLTHCMADLNIRIDVFEYVDMCCSKDVGQTWIHSQNEMHSQFYLHFHFHRNKFEQKKSEMKDQIHTHQKNMYN